MVFCTFWLRNVLRATACTFSRSEPPKVVRAWCVLYILTWKCSSRHSGVHFVLCTFWLRNVLLATTACTFLSLIWPAGSAPAALASHFSTLQSHKSLEKHSVSRLSYLLAHLHLLSSYSFSSTLLSSNLSLLSASSLFAFHLSILSEVCLLNFLRLFSFSSPAPSSSELNRQVLKRLVTCESELWHPYGNYCPALIEQRHIDPSLSTVLHWMGAQHHFFLESGETWNVAKPQPPTPAFWAKQNFMIFHERTSTGESLLSYLVAVLPNWVTGVTVHIAIQQGHRTGGYGDGNGVPSLLVNWSKIDMVYI